MQALLLVFASTVVGGGLAAGTLVGLLNHQTAPPSHSPASVSNPVLNYGSTE